MTVPEDRQVLIPDELRAQLLANGAAREDAAPVLKLFNPVGAATWLISEMDPDDPDRLFGLCDLGMGSPELGYVSLEEIASVRLPFSLCIERDEGFRGRLPLTVWADIARDLGSIREAEDYVARLPPAALSPPAAENPGG